MATNKAELMMEALMAFNRKERYHVLRHAVLGGPMTLSDRFRQDLERVLGWESSTIPDNAYVAMDYHLDWVSAAYYIGGKESKNWDNGYEYTNFPNNKNKPLLSGGPEDVDLLVAFTDGDKVFLIFIEAKADTPWNMGQLVSKSEKLISVLGDIHKKEKLVHPRFVLLGPKKRDFCKSDLEGEWPSWFFVKGKVPILSMGPSRELLKPTRTHKADNGKYLKWKLERSTNFEPDKDEAE